ncbi:hypothetical protein ACXYMT_01535 [Salinimicrobium sp. CAU 1759]
MIPDFIKVRITNRAIIEKIRCNSLLTWNSKEENLSHFDFEEVYTKETRICKGILFCFYTNYLEVLFRPHYYFNYNKHNANDFPVKNCIQVVQEFIDILNIDEVEKLKVVNLEFGVNVIPEMEIEDLITFITYHQKNDFKTDRRLSYSKRSYTSTSNGKENTYKIIKAYAKGLQFPEYTDRNTFRFEVKSKKSRYINKLGIYNITDLLNPQIYNRLATELLKELSEVLILDNNTDFTNLTRKEKQTLKEYLNTHTWYKILQNKRSRNNFAYHKKKYLSLLGETEKDIHKNLRQTILKKIQTLQFSAYSPPKKPLNNSAYSPNYIRGNRTKLETKICPVTRLPIDMQKEDSFLLSNTGLKYLQQTNPAKFNFLKDQLLTGNPNHYERNIYSMISKQIRNRYFNNPGRYQEQTLF